MKKTLKLGFGDDLKLVEDFFGIPLIRPINVRKQVLFNSHLFFISRSGVGCLSTLSGDDNQKINSKIRKWQRFSLRSLVFVGSQTLLQSRFCLRLKTVRQPCPWEIETYGMDHLSNPWSFLEVTPPNKILFETEECPPALQFTWRKVPILDLDHLSSFWCWGKALLLILSNCHNLW